MAEESIREIEVRGLTGESTTVRISPEKTIQDLKLLLKQKFPPASNSPNFHLFLKGTKLGLQTLIGNHSIGVGEFMVLVPYKKKDQQQNQHHDKAETSNEGQSMCSTSKAADSAWTSMMEDLSFLRNISSDGDQTKDQMPHTDFSGANGVIETPTVNRAAGTKRKRRSTSDKQEVHRDSLIKLILGSAKNTQLGEENCERLVQALESTNCLSDPSSGSCVFREASVDDNGIQMSADKDDLCLCPSWLRTIMKAFYLLNIYSAYLQKQCEKVTSPLLSEALNHLSKFGLQVGMADIDQLSVLCPKVVHFVNDEMDFTDFPATLVIIRSSLEEKNQVESISGCAQRNVPTPRVVSALKKRERSFRTSLCNAVKLHIHNNGYEMVNLFSLEDLVMLVRQGDNAANRKEGNCARRNLSAVPSSNSLGARCHGTDPLLPAEMVEHLRRGIGSSGQMVHVEEISARVANYVDIPIELSENMQSALRSIGITRLYSHQAESVRASLSGKNVVVATMTSSGKSLCYNLPVLEVLSQDLLACALYLFPTKALAQDQLRALSTMAVRIDATLNMGIYDGDTSEMDRLWLRDNSRLLITNPDMLHMSIMPFHGKFSRIFSNLRFIVIDEAHAYKGAFGCHTALILRRLRRLCSHVYGSDPSFIFCTATSANPSEHAMELSKLPAVELVQNDGSPSARKLFVLWNPPLCLKTVPKRSRSSIDKEPPGKNIILRRSSPILEISCLFAEIVQHGLRCIAFCKTRKLCELVLCYTREILQETAPHLVDSICAYRAGYVAEDRRRIEKDFFSGNLCGVAATNALELGIDVGHIDATLHLGFPGSIASLWQQAGRSGRREKPSLAVYVAFEGPLDQYFMKFPQKLFRSPIECCHVDAQNPQVLEQHVTCAAVEHPISFLHDEKYFGPRLEEVVATLKGKGYLTVDPSRDYSSRIWTYIGHEKMPSRVVSIRAIETEKYKVIDMQKDEVIEEIEESKAFFQVYEGAVYMHQGKTYLVKELNISTKLAFCQVADLKYYTKTRDYTDIHVIGGELAYPVRMTNIPLPRTTAQSNSCKVTTTWFGFYRIWKGSNQIFDSVELLLPKYSYDSRSVWIRVPQSIKAAVESRDLSFRAGLHAAGHALLNVVPLYIICNSSDLASECVNPHDTRYVPERILLYDQHPGGTGISAQIQPLFTELLTAALELLTSCYCSGDTGCPNCVQSLACHEYNEVLHKEAAIIIIRGVLDAEKSYFEKLS